MKRIDTTNRALDLFGAGKDGFKDGNLGLGQLPTEFNADWPNGIQEELLSVVETAGLAASGADLTQLRKAIDVMLRKMTGAVAAAGGTANAITGAFTPVVTALINGMRLMVRATAANTTTTPTFAADATAAKTIVRPGGAALAAGDIAGAGHWISLAYDLILDKWVLNNPAIPDLQPGLPSVAASVAANALTLTLNPTVLSFRNSALSNGSVNHRRVTSAISLTISSGSTLGTANAVASQIVVLAIDNAGTVELAAVNLAGGALLDETGLITTTAEGGAGAADSATVIYSQVARANVPYRVVAVVESTQAAAGTWATAPSKVQPVGGQAFNAMGSLGFGQTWQNVTGSRAFNTTYTNTTGKPIMMALQIGASAVANINVGGIATGQIPTAASQGGIGYAVIPAGYTYSVPGSGSLGSWTELR